MIGLYGLATGFCLHMLLEEFGVTAFLLGIVLIISSAMAVVIIFKQGDL